MSEFLSVWKKKSIYYAKIEFFLTLPLVLHLESFFFFPSHKYFDSSEPSGNKQLTAYCSDVRNPQGGRVYILKADKIVQPCRQQTFSQLLIEQEKERGKKKRN